VEGRRADRKVVGLEQVVASVEAEMARVDRFLQERLRPGKPELLPLLEHAARFKGKRLRPAQVLLAGKALGGITEDHTKVAAVVELIHTATLVHDDILDDATLRRKLPTLHTLYGIEASLLLGDYIYAVAFTVSTSLEDQTCSQVLGEVTRTVCQGEISQVLFKGKTDLTEEDYLEIIGAKTASLYGAACELGAHYAGAPGEIRERFRNYGYNLGLAFQVVDDCLDLAGDEGKVGKTLGSDVAKGKMTLPLIRVFQGAGEEGRKELERLFRDVPPGERRRILEERFDLARGVAYAREKARRFARAGLDALENLEGEKSSMEALRRMASFVLDREW